jgi:ABC-2 type transport system permease protein
MFRRILTKTLYEKRWMIIIWSLAVFVANILLIQLYPPIRDMIGNITADAPESVQALLGDAATFSTVKGYVSQEIFTQSASFVVIFAIIFATMIFASEEKSGTMLTQLARPIRRETYLLAKFAALIVGLLAVMVCFWLGVWLGTVILGDAISLIDLIVPSKSVFLLGLAFGSLTLGLGAIFGRFGLASAIVGFYAVAFNLISSIHIDAAALTFISKLSPWYWYNTPPVLTDGISGWHVLALVDFIIVPIIVGLIVFARRDLNTR